MTQTRTKVYRTSAEMQADIAEATAHGWHVTGHLPQPDGTTSVTFSQGGSEWAASPKDIQKAMSEALHEDRVRAERDKLISGIVGLVFFGALLWWLFGQPTLEDLQTMSVGELLDGWIFPAS
jgi:hypothetical protein